MHAHCKKGSFVQPNAQDFLRKARVNKRSDSPWRVRFDGLFLSHISILCWSFARWLVNINVVEHSLNRLCRITFHSDYLRLLSRFSSQMLARVMVKERVTRQLLRSASRQLDTFTDEGAQSV